MNSTCKLIAAIVFIFISNVLLSQTNTLPNNGYVGIGTTTPSALLDVNGNMVVDSSVVIKDSLNVQKKLIVDQDLKIQGESVFVGDGKFKNDLKVLGTAKMNGDLDVDGLTKINGDVKVFGDLKLVNLQSITNPSEFLTIENNGKVRSLDKISLLKIIYGPPVECIISENGGPSVISSWSQKPNPGYGILYTSTSGCPTRVGIGTDNPIASLDVRGRISMSTGAFAGYIPVSDANGTMSWTDPSSIGTNSVWNINTATNSNDIYYSGGNVSIGTLKTTAGQTDFMLSVAGNVRAESVEVSLKQTWPDYVFNKDYKLNNLHEIEEYINKNKHLPNVPSEEEVKREGINLGEMDAILLRKIEELTLYVIQQQKQIEALEKQVNKQN